MNEVVVIHMYTRLIANWFQCTVILTWCQSQCFFGYTPQCLIAEERIYENIPALINAIVKLPLWWWVYTLWINIELNGHIILTNFSLLLNFFDGDRSFLSGNFLFTNLMQTCFGLELLHLVNGCSKIKRALRGNAFWNWEGIHPNFLQKKRLPFNMNRIKFLVTSIWYVRSKLMCWIIAPYLSVCGRNLVCGWYGAVDCVRLFPFDIYQPATVIENMMILISSVHMYQTVIWDMVLSFTGCTQEPKSSTKDHLAESKLILYLSEDNRHTYILSFFQYVKFVKWIQVSNICLRAETIVNIQWRWHSSISHTFI